MHEADDVVLVPADTGNRDQLESATCLAARLAVIDASRNVTSVRGVMTSRTSRSPARKTSSISRRSSLVSDSCAATRSRNSSWLIASPLTFGSPPSSLTRAFVDVDRTQTIGRDSVASRLSERGDQHRQPLGPLQGQPLGGQLAQDQRQVADGDGDADEGQRPGHARADAALTSAAARAG